MRILMLCENETGLGLAGSTIDKRKDPYYCRYGRESLFSVHPQRSSERPNLYVREARKMKRFCRKKAQPG